MPRIDDPSSTQPLARPKTPGATKPAPAVEAAATPEAVAKIATDALKVGATGKAVLEAGAKAVAPAETSFFGRLKSGLSSLWNKTREAASWVTAGVTASVNFLMKTATGTTSAKFETRQVYDDPSDVNHPSRTEVEYARVAIKSADNEAKVAAALTKLSPDQKKQYDAVSQLTVGRPTAELALQTMLLDGRLTGGKDLKGGGSALANLAALAAQPLAEGIDRRTLVSEVLGEIENPVRINQHNVGTCGATTAQILLIRQNPAEYVRLMTGLASPSGKAQMAGGDTIERVSDWDATNDGERTTSSRLFQPAVMDYGEPLPGDRYDNSEDRAKWGPIPLFSGLMSIGGICEQLTGKPYNSTMMMHWNRDSAWDEMKTALKDGPVPVAVRWNTSGSAGGHFVQIDKVADGKVYITNPWGQRESFSEAEFKAHVTTLTMPGK